MTPGPTLERFFVRYQCRTAQRSLKLDIQFGPRTRTAYVAAYTELEALITAYEVLGVPVGREDDVTIYPAPWPEAHGQQV